MNKQPEPTTLEIVAAGILGGILGGGMIALYFYLTGGF
jgi:hypothetical protein